MAVDTFSRILHTTKKYETVKEYCEERIEFAVLPTASLNSLDLNQIEHMWDIL